jgi:hypothetical protein
MWYADILMKDSTKHLEARLEALEETLKHSKVSSP